MATIYKPKGAYRCARCKAPLPEKDVWFAKDAHGNATLRICPDCWSAGQSKKVSR